MLTYKFGVNISRSVAVTKAVPPELHESRVLPSLRVKLSHDFIQQQYRPLPCALLHPGYFSKLGVSKRFGCPREPYPQSI